MNRYNYLITYRFLFFIIFLISVTAHAETVTLEDLIKSKKKYVTNEKSQDSQPNPSGLGINDPRIPKKESNFETQKENLNIQLFFAIGDDDVDYAKSQIMQGADPNSTVPGSDMRILMVAQSAGMVKMLVKNGAEQNLKDNNGATALHYHVLSPSALEIVPILIKTGANVNAEAKGLGGSTPLIEASQWYFEGRDHSVGERLIRLLVSAGADINATEYFGKTLLHKAVENEKKDLLKIMLELGADKRISDSDGFTPLDRAKNMNLNAIAKMLE
jgi:Ankyrin repeats (3 copies)